MNVDEIARINAEKIRAWTETASVTEYEWLHMDEGYIYMEVAPLYLTTRYRVFVSYLGVDKTRHSFIVDCNTLEEAREAIPELKMQVWRCFFL